MAIYQQTGFWTDLGTLQPVSQLVFIAMSSTLFMLRSNTWSIKRVFLSQHLFCLLFYSPALLTHQIWSCLTFKNAFKVLIFFLKTIMHSCFMKFNQMISTLLHSHFSKQLNSNCKTTTYHYSSIICSLFTHNSQNSACTFYFGTDDDHRVVLESISDGVDCEHDYMNASYIDVRYLLE